MGWVIGTAYFFLFFCLFFCYVITLGTGLARGTSGRKSMDSTQGKQDLEGMGNDTAHGLAMGRKEQVAMVAYIRQSTDSSSGC